MPRTISPGLLAELQSKTARLAIIIEVLLLSGTVLRFTTWSERLTVSGQSYEPIDGIVMSTLQSSEGTTVDTGSLDGQYVDTRITEAMAGRGELQGAVVTISICSLDNLAAGSMVWQRFGIGETRHSELKWSGETRGLQSRLKMVSGDLTSKQCRCRRLGDIECKLNMAGNKTVSGTPYAIRSSRAVVSGSTSMELRFTDPAPTGFYSLGIVTFTTGPNIGLSREIRVHTLSSGTAICKLVEPFPFPVAIADVATLEAGCDGLFATCDVAFSNANNFHGEPRVPGNDAFGKVGK